MQYPPFYLFFFFFFFLARSQHAYDCQPLRVRRNLLLSYDRAYSNILVDLGDYLQPQTCALPAGPGNNYIAIRAYDLLHLNHAHFGSS